MTKIKKPNTQKPLVVFGYIIFALLVIGVLFSTTIPFGKLLLDPNTIHYNVALFTIVLTIGALLPATLGYIIGDHSVKSKSSTGHHFNGMLFGLLAFWMMLIFSSIASTSLGSFAISHNTQAILVNILPSVAVAIVLSILATAHLRNRKANHDIVEYNSYGILLIGSILLMPIWSLINNISTQSVGMYPLFPFIIFIVLGAIPYITLRKSKLSVFRKLTWSAVSISVAYAAGFASSQFVTGLSYYINNRPSTEFQVVVDSAGWILALIGWVIFWHVQAKSLSKK